MYKNIPNYIPFEHENIELKNNLISLARNQDKTSVQGAFAAVVIYANLVDYLAKHLLENLLKMISIQSFQMFSGILFFDGSMKKTDLPLGALVRELSYFEFPNKIDFIQLLNEFNSLRNDVLHNLMRLDPDDSTKDLGKNIEKIGAIAEDLLKKYNAICPGLHVLWNSIYNPPPPPDESGVGDTAEDQHSEADDSQNG